MKMKIVISNKEPMAENANIISTFSISFSLLIILTLVDPYQSLCFQNQLTFLAKHKVVKVFQYSHGLIQGHE